MGCPRGGQGHPQTPPPPTPRIYLLRHRLKRDYHLKVLAFTVDVNIPSLAWESIRRALAKLDIDHVVYRPSNDFYERIFRYALRHQEERGAVYTVSYIYAPLFEGDAIRLAMEKGIPLVLAGYSPAAAGTGASGWGFQARFLVGFDPFADDRDVAAPVAQQAGEADACHRFSRGRQGFDPVAGGAVTARRSLGTSQESASFELIETLAVYPQVARLAEDQASLSWKRMSPGRSRPVTIRPTTPKTQTLVPPSLPFLDLVQKTKMLRRARLSIGASRYCGHGRLSGCDAGH